MNHCKICKHLDQYHNKEDNHCLACSMIINIPELELPIDGYCGRDNLKYLELRSGVRR